MRFGMFMAPFHWPGQNASLALQRDLELIELLDRLGFDEVWVGEHHSGGTEIIPSPEIFLAFAAERTRHIRLGTGVVSLPYHNPFTVAHRAALMDHLTRGRFMLGCGPGQLASDAGMLAVPVDELRPRMQESLDVIVRLLDGDVVTEKSSWFELNEARLQLTPWSAGGLELAVTGTISPNGAQAAGRHGIGLLSMAATTPLGFSMLKGHWNEYEKAAAESGQASDRSRWRAVGPVHIAETREEARRDVEYGIEKFAHYFHHVVPGGLWEGTTVDEILASNDERGTAIIGTPDDAVDRLRAIDEHSGGFGTFLIMNSDWASPAATRRSLELFAQCVIPHFDGRSDAAVRSWEWVDGQHDDFAAQNWAAISKVGLVLGDIGDVQP